MFSSDINPEILWTELKDNGIDEQFFRIIGKSIVCNKKFCVDFDDVVEFTGYARKDHAKRYLMDNFRNEKDYVILRKSEIDERDDILLPFKGELNGIKESNNKIYIFLTKFAFYSFVISANTKKSKEIRSQVIDIYNKYHELLMYCRQMNLNKNNQNAKENAIKLYSERLANKNDEYKKTKQREIKTLKTTIQTLRDQREKFKDSTITLQHSLDNYKKLYRELEEECKSMKNDMESIKEIIESYVDQKKAKIINKEIDKLLEQYE